MGSNSKISTGLIGTFTTLSIGGWVYVDHVDSTAHEGYFFSIYNNAPDKGILIGVNDAGALFFATSSTGSDMSVSTTAASTMSSGGWHHIVAVYDGAYKRIYLNGAEVVSGDFPAVYSSGIYNSVATPIFGSIYAGAAFWGRLYGHIDEAFIYKGALSAAQVSDIYTNGDY